MSLTSKAISLLVDIAYRVPTNKIVFDGIKYYLLSGKDYSKRDIAFVHIQELIDAEYVDVNSYGGIVLLSKAIDDVSSHLTFEKVKNSHGKDVDIVKMPNEY